MPADPGSRRRQAGFTIVEMIVVLVLLLVGLLMAADLLMESSRLFVETAGEANDTLAPLALARLRADIQAGTGVIPQRSPDDGELVGIAIPGGPKDVVYTKDGDSLYRTVSSSSEEKAEPPVLVWRGVTDWSCCRIGEVSPVLSITYQRRSTPHTPLPVLPAYRGPLTEDATETLYLLPRGNGW
jgi:prepilin-type N-terminal cleavage/methylation domain-containing protein